MLGSFGIQLRSGRRLPAKRNMNAKTKHATMINGRPHPDPVEFSRPCLPRLKSAKATKAATDIHIQFIIFACYSSKPFPLVSAFRSSVRHWTARYGDVAAGGSNPSSG